MTTSPSSKEMAKIILEQIVSYLCEEVAVVSVGEIDNKQFYPAYNILVSVTNDEAVFHCGEEQSMTKELFLDILAHDLEVSKSGKPKDTKILTLMIFGRDAISVLKDIDNMNISYPDTARMWTLKHGTVEPTRNAFMYEWNRSDFEQGPALIDGKMDFYDDPYHAEYDSLTDLGKARENYQFGILTPEETAQEEEVAIIKARSAAAVEVATYFIRDIVFSNAPLGNHSIVLNDDDGEMEVKFASDSAVVFANPDVEEFRVRLATSIALNATVEVILTSYLNEDPYTKDIQKLCMDSSPQEIRGWLFLGPAMSPYIADEIIDVCCIDTNGKIIDPKPNAAYRTAWIYPATQS